MKRTLDNLMMQCPSWILRRRVEEHPSNGLGEVFQALKKLLPTSLKCAKGDIICTDVVYTKVKLNADGESYGSAIISVREFIIVEFTSSAGNGCLQIPEYGLMEYVIDLPDKSIRYERDSLGVRISEMYDILQDHRDFPIWKARCATLTFLLCARSLPFPRDVSKVIAKEVWASRRDQRVWWPGFFLM